MLPEEETESDTPLTQYSSKFLVIDNLLAELRATTKERIVLVSYSTQVSFFPFQFYVVDDDPCFIF